MMGDGVFLLSDTANAAVVRIPGRASPGVVIQGDSLRNLYLLTRELRQRITQPGEAVDLAEEVRDLLAGYLKAYEETLRRKGIELPYPRPVFS
jgi:hypothetical protein